MGDRRMATGVLRMCFAGPAGIAASVLHGIFERALSCDSGESGLDGPLGAMVEHETRKVSSVFRGLEEEGVAIRVGLRTEGKWSIVEVALSGPPGPIRDVLYGGRLQDLALKTLGRNPFIRIEREFGDG